MEETTQELPSGDSSQGSAEGKDSDFVKHSSYAKAINELKTAKQRAREVEAKANEYETTLKAIEEQKLLDEKKHLELIDQLKREKESLSQEVQNHLKDKTDFRKMNSILSLMQSKGISLESQYYGLLPVDSISIDESGELDGTSVAKAVELFQKQHPRLTTPLAKLLPNDKSGSSGPTISLEQWKKLGPKERTEAYSQGRVKP